jgi:hypothetical protein
MEMLSSGLPVKVLVETRDLLEESALGAGHFAFGVRTVRHGMTAMGLGVFPPPPGYLERASTSTPRLACSAAAVAHARAARVSQHLAAAPSSRVRSALLVRPFAGDNRPLASRWRSARNRTPTGQMILRIRRRELATGDQAAFVRRFRAVRPALCRPLRPRAEGAGTTACTVVDWLSLDEGNGRMRALSLGGRRRRALYQS